MVRTIATKQKAMSSNRGAGKQVSKEKSQQTTSSLGHASLKVKPKPPSSTQLESKTVNNQKETSLNKTTAKNSLSNNEIHVTKDGVKVIDFHPDETEQCFMNLELKDYERENRHRYIPRNLSQKNLALQGKIDRDLE